MEHGVVVLNGQKYRLKVVSDYGDRTSLVIGAGTGAAVGIAVHAAIGGAGLAIGGTAISLGMLLMSAIGVIVGVAIAAIITALFGD